MMPSRNFDPRHSPLLEDTQQSEVIERLIFSEAIEQMASVLYFENTEQANAWVDAMHRADKFHLYHKKKKYILWALAQCAVHGMRVDKIVEALSRIVVPESHYQARDGGHTTRDSQNK